MGGASVTSEASIALDLVSFGLPYGLAEMHEGGCICIYLLQPTSHPVYLKKLAHYLRVIKSGTSKMYFMGTLLHNFKMKDLVSSSIYLLQS